MWVLTCVQLVAEDDALDGTMEQPCCMLHTSSDCTIPSRLCCLAVLWCVQLAAEDDALDGEKDAATIAINAAVKGMDKVGSGLNLEAASQQGVPAGEEDIACCFL